jgi:hypothetical protein
LIDEEARALLGQPGLFGQVSYPCALGADPREQPPLRRRDVVEAGRGQGLEHAGFHGSGRDVAEQPEVQLARPWILAHPAP